MFHVMKKDKNNNLLIFLSLTKISYLVGLWGIKRTAFFWKSRPFYYRKTKTYFHSNTFVTNSAASFSKIAEYTCKPDSSISFFASAALVPCRRTMIGTGIFPISL